MTRTLPRYRALILMSGILLATGIAEGQSPPADPLRRDRGTSITIRTDIDSALVILDGIRAGITPLTIDSITAGKHYLKLQHPDLRNWLTGSITDTLEITAGESRALRYMFERRSLIISEPFGADVYISDSLCGTTPLVMTHNQVSGAVTISIRKDGFEPVSTTLKTADRGILSLTLAPLWQKDGIAGPVLDGSSLNGSRHVRLYVAGATTVLAGIAAAYFKTRADSRFIEYNTTGNPSLLSETHRLDTAAGVSLVITQVGLGLFTYFILSD